MEPTVLNNVKQSMTVAREEIFGPVLSVLEYEDQEEAIDIANDTEYGLGAGVFTKDPKSILDCKQIRSWSSICK